MPESSPPIWDPPDSPGRVSPDQLSHSRQVPESGYTVPAEIAGRYVKAWGDRIRTLLLAAGATASLITQVYLIFKDKGPIPLSVDDQILNLLSHLISGMITGGFISGAVASDRHRKNVEI
jgi:hypothetical protein